MKTWTFPAGERGVCINTSHLARANLIGDTYEITCNFRGSDSIIDLLLETDAVRRTFPNAKIQLYIPYFPYARQDRVMQPGESHSLKVIAGLINSLNFSSVTVVDPHSDVVEALIDRVKIITQTAAIEQTIDQTTLESYDFFIAPDAGAAKKIWKTAVKYKKPVICAQKQRDVTTGVITSTRIYTEDFDKLCDARALVIDDICDGGRTFIELRKVLPNDTATDLYVTHGIFNAGREYLDSQFGQIYCYNDFTVNSAKR